MSEADVLPVLPASATLVSCVARPTTDTSSTRHTLYVRSASPAELVLHRLHFASKCVESPSVTVPVPEVDHYDMWRQGKACPEFVGSPPGLFMRQASVRNQIRVHTCTMLLRTSGPVCKHWLTLQPMQSPPRSILKQTMSRRNVDGVIVSPVATATLPWLTVLPPRLTSCLRLRPHLGYQPITGEAIGNGQAL